MRLTLGRHGRVSKQLPHLGEEKVSMTAWLGETRELCLGEDANLSAGTQPEPGCRIWKKMPKMPKTECLESSFRPCTTYHKMLSWIHQQTSNPKTGTSSKGYRSLARKKGNKPIGSYSAKSSTICIWYPDRYQTFCGFLGIVHMFSGKIPFGRTLPNAHWMGCEMTTRMLPVPLFQAGLVQQFHPVQTTTLSTSDSKGLAMQKSKKKHFSHNNVLKQKLNKHIELHIFCFTNCRNLSTSESQSTNSHIPPAVLQTITKVLVLPSRLPI